MGGKNLVRFMAIGLTLFGVAGGGGRALAASTLDGYSRAEEARKTYAQMMGKQATGLEKTDPELDAMMKEYIYGDIARQAKLSYRDQHLITLAVLVTQQNQSLLGKNV